MKRALLFVSLLTGCWNFEAGYVQCFDSGKCVEMTGGGAAGGAAGGMAGGTGGGAAGGSAGGTAGGAAGGTAGGTNGCADGGTSCPSGYACVNAMCKTACAATIDCQPNFECSSPPTCSRVAESDCLDGLDNNGDGLADCADPTCRPARVMCVPGVTAGNEIGVFVDAGSADAGCFGEYDLGTVEHKTLQVPACSACGCSVSGTCRSQLDFYMSSDCTSGLISNNVADGQVCAAVGATVPGSVKFNNMTLVAHSCVPGGGSTRSDATWASTQVFCAARRQSSGCPTNQVCVPTTSAPVCVRIPQSGQACPAGYTANALGTWNGAFTDDRVCGCGTCTADTVPTCGSGPPAGFLFYQDTTQCLANPGMGPNTGSALSSNATNNCLASNGWGTIGALWPFGNAATGGTCSRPGQVTSGSAVGTQPSTICCQ
jgi:hypothetical protein